MEHEGGKYIGRRQYHIMETTMVKDSKQSTMKSFKQLHEDDTPGCLGTAVEGIFVCLFLFLLSVSIPLNVDIVLHSYTASETRFSLL